MKKHLIGAGLLAACAVAQAQSSVTIYGLLDAALTVKRASGGTSLPGGGSTVASPGSITAIDSGVGPGGSRLGFRGEEDLGGGLSASFVLEGGFGVDTGAAQQGGLLFGRQAFVGIGSKAGWSVTVGRQYSPMNIALSLDDASYAFYWGNPTANSGFAVYDSIGAVPGSGAFGSPARQDKSILATATAGGFTGRLMVASGNNNDARGAGRMINPGVAYTAGPLAINASYARFRQNAESINAAATPEWLSDYVVGGSYDFGAVKLFTGIYGFKGPKNQSNLSPVASFGSAGASPFAFTWDKTQSYWLGGRIPLGAGTAILSVTKSKYDYATGPDGKSTALLAAYEYPLSKRTLVYGSVGRMSNNAYARSPLIATVSAIIAPGFGSNVSAASIGIRHTF